MPDANIHVGDIVQITDEAHPWYPCLLIVDEVKAWGVQAYASIPKANDGSEPPDLAYNRLKNEQFEVVGVATVVTANDESG